ncbi:putative membrane protein YdgH [Rubripirellula amarantea]|uniref:Putative membrane protein YdgH n=1 Tax=Rubripirellula amarantea TaxID=2527999 RepID=A0A5C5WTC0_9BACT|nr:MMPL family transporter [Rubripirellula amarantea]TWT53750.1 putative membrane protein YdgH [Rubripirellula amarantea]
MPRPLSKRWASWVVRYSWWIIGAWIILAITLRVAAPRWEDVALDGDFDYLPVKMSSVAGGRLLDEAFPGERSRSQIVLVLSRDPGENEKLRKTDAIVGLDLLRRLYHKLGEVSWQRAIKLGYEGGPDDNTQPWSPWIKLTREAFDTAIESDDAFYERIANNVPETAPTLEEPRLAIAYWDRGKLIESLGGQDDLVERDFEAALILKSRIPKLALPIGERDLTSWQSLLDVLSWQDPVIGSRLKKSGARLAVMQLSSELAATGNIATVEAVDQMIKDVVRYSGDFTEPGLKLELTGSAAIGGETLIAARDAIRYTESITVAMILLILAFVYRAPLLIFVPMISIAIAVIVSTSLIALLTDWSARGVVPGLDLRVFTTSRIFIVVILFGAGTDFCLFLISRLREEVSNQQLKRDWSLACEDGLSGVMSALIGSAMTTVVGLGMLWIASFGKFHYTGPVIALCLLVGLCVCISLTPALLRVIGPASFWPSTIVLKSDTVTVSIGDTSGDAGSSSLWSMIALQITRRPFLGLFLGLGILAFPAVYGFRQESAVTYDLSSQLSHAAKSRSGLRSLSSHFAIGEINPVTLLLVHDHDVAREDFDKQIKRLTKQIYAQEGVLTVRNADDPLGDFSPDREMGLLSGDAWKRRALRNHRAAQRHFFSSIDKYENRLARIDIVMDGDPFSLETSRRVSNLGKFLSAQASDPNADFSKATVLLTGTTPSIIDLRTVTLKDNRRIKVAVVIAVFIVLLLVIRRWLLCTYLIVTVLISYYATLGLTVLFFRYAYGGDFVGLDWKLPLFLFVILVAIGQDYNVYLVTRIVEEERRLGWIAALRRAVSRTGGIITACGLVMAATFFSMTSSAWLPAVAHLFGFEASGGGIALRGIVELGFALGLGVLIDTFYVRTILVPSFVAAIGTFRHRQSKAARLSDESSGD